jgi:hypothetical protein
MSTTPDARRIRAAQDAVARLWADRKVWQRTLTSAYERDRRGGTATPDGYPSGSGLAGRSGSADSTPTEAAVLRRMGRITDPLHVDVLRADAALAALDAAATQLLGAVARLAELDTDPEELDRPRCYLCPKLRLADSELTRHGTAYTALVDGRTVMVCRWAADNVRARAAAIARGAPGFHGTFGRLPTRDEVDAHHAGKNVPLAP